MLGEICEVPRQSRSRLTTRVYVTLFLSSHYWRWYSRTGSKWGEGSTTHVNSLCKRGRLLVWCVGVIWGERGENLLFMNLNWAKNIALLFSPPQRQKFENDWLDWGDTPPSFSFLTCFFFCPFFARTKKSQRERAGKKGADNCCVSRVWEASSLNYVFVYVYICHLITWGGKKEINNRSVNITNT